MSVGPIPWTATTRWADRHGVGDRKRFEFLIERLDETFLARDKGKDEKVADDG